MAIDLVSAQRTFEDSIELLWNGLLPPRSAAWAPLQVPDATARILKSLERNAPSIRSRELMTLVAAACAVGVMSDGDMALGSPAMTARHLIQTMANAFGLLRQPPSFQPARSVASIAEHVARSSGIPVDQEVLYALNACLVLCADHELAPATFAARIAASAGADIFSCVGSALGCFEGALGVRCDDAEHMLRTAKSPKIYVNALRAKAARRELLSGFGHPMYPNGDPRAVALLEIARDLSIARGAGRGALDAIDLACSELDVKPNLALGLASVAISLEMPQGSAEGLMALGRTAGWIAHAFEQRLAGLPLRPRARYVGPPPQ